ncbi:MAG TPA: TonB-dependent receptor plug domain-containing protein [Lacunisphaera sp.]|nr:TonB-dependent receptor plug domain-containing protein [Lacunisphaera sp.]
MKHPTVRSRALVGTAALCLVTALRLAAQSTAPAATPNPQETEEVLELSPFIVEATEDSGYAAKSTLAGTRIRTELKDVGSSISVVTQKFLTDTNSRNASELLVYTPSTEVAGQGGNYLGQGSGIYLTNAATGSSTTTRVRGLAQADNTRDFYLTDIPWDGYNVGRVDLQRGPNAILFGIGSPAGIVNTSLNQASYKNGNKVENQIDNFGSIRFTGDFNRVLIKDELAVRVSLLKDKTKYRQDPAYKNDERVYGAVRWDPGWLKTESARTSLRANFESGTVTRNDPINTPPLDLITPFYAFYNAADRAQGFSASVNGPGIYLGNRATPLSQTDPWLGAPGNRVFDGVVTAFNGASQGSAFASQIKAWPQPFSATGTVLGSNNYLGITTYAAGVGGFTGNTQKRGYTIGAFKAKSLTDPTIFDFYDNLLPGPNQEQYNHFHSLNAALTQTFFHEKLGFELSFDKQYANFGQTSFVDPGAVGIAIDIMRTLIDGSANPNFGRPVVYAGGGGAGFGWTHTTRESKRATVFGEVNFADIAGKESVLNRVFGRNVLTALATEQKTDRFSANGAQYYISDAFGPTAPGTGNGSIGQASRDDIFAIYLGAPINTLSWPAGINLTGIKNTITPTNNQTINYYNAQTASWQTIPLPIVNNNLAGERDKTYRGARLTADKVKSTAFVWQGYWLDGMIIPMFGYRTDKDTFRDAGTAPGYGNGLQDPFSPSFKLPDVAIENTVRSKTYSLVTHLPKSLREKLPGNLDVSLLYNKSENFQPDSSRRDIVGDPVANPAGNTKEYGIVINALNDRLVFKVARYETKVANATVSGGLSSGQYLIGAVETWGQQSAFAFRNSLAIGGPLSGNANTLYGRTSDGLHQVTWEPDGPTPTSGPIDPYTGRFAYSAAVLDATYAKEKASIDAWFAQQVPANFQKAWGMTDYATGGSAQNYGASGLVVTGDTLSKGTEYELIVSPIKGLDISVNASKTFATQTNLAQSYVNWITARFKQFNSTPSGDMRLWGPGNTGETALSKYSNETMAGFNLFQALQGSAVPELRPWRFNATASYTFQGDSRFKGFNVGGSFRWQNGNVTGFPIIGAGTAADPLVYDVAHPYHGPQEGIADGWIGYSRKVSDKLQWSMQLNVRNILAKDHLQLVTVQPDGTPGAYRIQEPRTIVLTNTFRF